MCEHHCSRPMSPSGVLCSEEGTGRTKQSYLVDCSFRTSPHKDVWEQAGLSTNQPPRRPTQGREGRRQAWQTCRWSGEEPKLFFERLPWQDLAGAYSFLSTKSSVLKIQMNPNLRNGGHLIQCPHVPDKAIEAQRNSVTWPKLSS